MLQSEAMPDTATISGIGGKIQDCVIYTANITFNNRVAGMGVRLQGVHIVEAYMANTAFDLIVPYTFLRNFDFMVRQDTEKSACLQLYREGVSSLICKPRYKQHKLVGWEFAQSEVFGSASSLFTQRGN